MNQENYNNFYAENVEELRTEVARLLPIFEEMLKEKGPIYLVEYAYNYVDDILKQVKLSEKTSCGSGCSFCCHSIIYSSQFEHDYIKMQTKKHSIKGDKKRSKLQNSKTEAQLKWVEKACKYLSSTDGKGFCTIYEIRPLVCRTHNSTDITELCNKDKFNGIPNQEARLIQTEAVLITLALMDENSDETKNNNLRLIPIHKIMP